MYVTPQALLGVGHDEVRRSARRRLPDDHGPRRPSRENSGQRAGSTPRADGASAGTGRSNVSDAQRLSQSEFDAAGAGTMWTAFTSHVPGAPVASATRPRSSVRATTRVSGASRRSAKTSAPRSGLPS